MTWKKSLLPTGTRESRFSMAYSHPYSWKKPDDLEVMMKIDTPLHADHQLDQLAAQFEHWRQSRSHPHDCIPETLWDQAVALTQTLSPSRVAKHVRLGGSDLKKQITKRQGQAAAHRAMASGFVEVPNPSARPQTLSGIEVELHRPDGARLRLHSPDASLPLAAIVQSFLEAR
jgi:hypothetical protein